MAGGSPDSGMMRQLARKSHLVGWRTMLLRLGLLPDQGWALRPRLVVQQRRRSMMGRSLGQGSRWERSRTIFPEAPPRRRSRSSRLLHPGDAVPQCSVPARFPQVLYWGHLGPVEILGILNQRIDAVYAALNVRRSCTRTRPAADAVGHCWGRGWFGRHRRRNGLAGCCRRWVGGAGSNAGDGHDTPL